MIFKNF